MKFFKYILLCLTLAVMAPQAVQAKKTQADKLYLFGFAASFKDSVVYFTDVQEVRGAWVDSKTKFLLGRQHYSYQLKEHLANQLQQPDRVCVVFFAEKRQDAEKKYLKLRRQYTGKSKKKYDVRYLENGDFKFQAVDMSSEE